MLFNENAARQLSSVQYYGIDNFAPSDGTGTLLQPSMPSGLQVWLTENVSGYNGKTTITDSDNHSRAWTYDALWRVTQTQAWASSSYALTSSAAWDTYDDLTASVDPRGNETDYAYDANGNTLAVAKPSVTTNAGGLRPTATFSYDAFNNVVSYCDPVYNTTNSWYNPANPPPTCPNIAGATRYTYSYPTWEPFGIVTDSYTPLGSHKHFTYDANNYGLPISVADDGFTQENGSTIAPTQLFSYDGFGNLVCYSKLQDGAGTHWYRLTYDSLNRRTAVADPDDATLSVAACPNAGVPGSYVVTNTGYYNDSSVAFIQTPAEHAGGFTPTYQYDSDGDQVSSTQDYGGAPGTKQSFYDGDDRLVEVIEPTNDNWNIYPWLTRYIYDLTQGGSVSMQYGSAYTAYGNLYKTQRLVPGTLVTFDPGSSTLTVNAQNATRQSLARAAGTSSPKPTATPSAAISAFRARVFKPSGANHLQSSAGIVRLNSSRSAATNARAALARPMLAEGSVPSGSWYDVSGSGFDGLDRKVAGYKYIPGENTISTDAFQFDQSSSYDAPGLLVDETTPVGDVKSYSYDNDGNQTAVAFANSTASTFTAGRNYSVDPDGRTASVGNAQFGTWQYKYDQDGRETWRSSPPVEAGYQAAAIPRPRTTTPTLSTRTPGPSRRLRRSATATTRTACLRPCRLLARQRRRSR